jgi:hypothetical protein
MLVAQDFGGDNHFKIDKNAINLRHVNDYFNPFWSTTISVGLSGPKLAH